MRVVYLAIMEERHIGFVVMVFLTFSGAKEQIDKWYKNFPHITKWEYINDEPEEMFSNFDGSSEGISLFVAQADEEQEEGLVFLIQKKEFLT